MEEYMQDLTHDLDEDALEIEDTPEVDDLENAHRPDDDVTVDEHTSYEDVPEDVVAPDEVVPPAPTTPDRPIQQHPLPPTVDNTDLNNEHIANHWATVEEMRIAQARRYMAAEYRDHLHRQAGPHMRRTRDVAARDDRARLNAELIEIVASVHPNAPRARLRAISRYRCQTCGCWTGRTRATPTECIIWTVSLSLATDETPDLRQTLANAEDHVRSGRAECGRERDEAEERAEILRHRRVANENNTESRVRELRHYRRAEHYGRLEQEMLLFFSEGVE
ncbi:uncharacterized protein NECHADRAFT_83997 [Fusarium vanettenii 77-13-4]|uniref:Uncharacterized protein n=1 Tax=Fusarium vanettenii (strain ATCC MYA-4622 / CBS 123669 / FGSC 9596 / NRRL 45880 / 77-13-4) TaxID=660122 RepID=C7YZE0_FUSV7|nr:uncharacterized protein NECHADRAFT_83997 [Fusarium vanettenii 77-13-4]EEU42788.1 predicted protein [Fusarium vanettenii 77-13-4]